MTSKPITESRTGSAFARAMGVGALVLMLSACDGLFDIENPTNLLDEDLTNRQLEATLSNSAEGALGSHLSYAMRYGTLITDDYWHPSLQTFGLELDRGYRNRANEAVESMYNRLASGVWIANEMGERLTEMVTNPAAHRGIADSHFFGAEGRMALAGYFREVTYDAQAPITPFEAIEDAIEGYQKAAQIAGALGDANLQAASYGGMARGYRSLYYEPIAMGGTGNPSHFQLAEQWARTALQTHSTYLKQAEFGSPGPSNDMSGTGREQMTPWTAFRVDPVSGQLDPRITHTRPDTAPDGLILLRDMKYWPKTDPSVSLPLQRAAEAELIVAEARLVAGDVSGAVEFINRVRARSGLPPFATSSISEAWEQLKYERDTEMWLEGRKWEDHRYYGVIPRAWDEVNKLEGVSQRFPISVQERNNNPNYPGNN